MTSPTGMAPLVRSEWRKATSTRLWWALLVPVAMVSALVNGFGGVFTAAFADLGAPSLLPVSLAYALSLTSVFAALFAVVAAAGEFRHRTITTTYLIAPRRFAVQGAKSVVAAGVGASYAVAAVLAGVPVGLLARPAPLDVGLVLTVLAVGVVVAALWAVLGTAVGIAVGNLSVALAGTLAYLLAGELLLSLLINRADSPLVARLSSYLPGNAGDVALYDVPVRALLGGVRSDGPDSGRVVELLAGVTQPPPWWGALIVLGVWTAAAAATAAVIGGRRDVT